MGIGKLVFRGLIIGLLSSLITACGDSSKLPEEATQGPNPTLPAPTKSFIPTVNLAKAQGWPDGVVPTPAEGMQVNAFAEGLEHPRWLYVLPNGDVLVAETNAPEQPEDNSGGGLMGKIRSIVARIAMRSAGAEVQSPDRIVLLRDADGDGVAETKSVFLKDLHSPFGMALVNGSLYVANTDAVVRFPYEDGQTEMTAKGETLAELPGGPINHHWTKSLVASPDGAKLYVGVGSNSNVAENGLAAERRRAAILEIDRESGMSRIYASGLRNPVGLAFEPETEMLWTVVNERDELGSDLVPDYLTSVQPGGFYGWPFSYWGDHVDHRVSPQNPELVAQAIVPDYALGNHVAALGLAFAPKTSSLPADFANGAFVGEHGSWNRKPRSGYKVVFVAFEGGKPVGQPVDVLTGFLSDDGKAYGRPVGVAFDKTGALLVADDVGNRIWRVSGSARQAAAAP
ncbi:sorbosone dehydrogenase family protein [Methyloligella sp. 2.7D]|uniref:PQQ-dependent sugar dehydrogenase n=1 Tax=unclassified Methyloligella TaxID=2625955 RepID=UPI00157D929A|nr:sorbosone dehydrogenase family protein [Methyloligella sp. GL2]QKP76400.1 sorbosone dehydrogenase family protein [Methyloligella sp. GL2]